MPNQINLNEKFIHLSKAPIVEAILDFRVSSENWNEATLRSELKQKLSEFPKIEDIRQTQIQLVPAESEKSSVKDVGCIGFKLSSNDNIHIVQFNKMGFTFSRLKPYENWENFRVEALRLWEIYNELLKPTEIFRIGLRFLNRFDIKKDNINLSDYYSSPPVSLKNLKWPLTGYLHHDMIQIPETKYTVNLIKTVQNIPGENGLLLDIDVFLQNQNHSIFDKGKIIESLEEMHWIKNKTFFSSITKKLVKELK